jgi:hypothetical protein
MRPINGLTCLAFAALGIVGSAQAQAQAPSAADPTCPRTRAEVRAECVEFLRTHQWDEANSNYVLKPGMKGPAKATPPEGVKTRAEIRAERDAFLRANRWNEASSQWEPIGGKPRDLSTLSRADVLKETKAFMRTHHWDEGAETYVENKPRAKTK